MNKYMLRLLPNGDIDIITDDEPWIYKSVYHKTFNPGENIKDNLMEAYEEWAKLLGLEDE